MSSDEWRHTVTNARGWLGPGVKTIPRDRQGESSKIRFQKRLQALDATPAGGKLQAVFQNHDPLALEQQLKLFYTIQVHHGGTMDAKELFRIESFLQFANP